jgi:hypothetical protein
MPPLHGDAGTSAPLEPDRKSGVRGESDSGYGVAGTSNTGNGVQGGSIQGLGVVGTSTSATGVYGTSLKAGVYPPLEGGGPDEEGGVGVMGENNLLRGTGVLGRGEAAGVRGVGHQAGVLGESKEQVGVQGVGNVGVFGSPGAVVTINAEWADTGVVGLSPDSYGVRGYGGDIGVYAANLNEPQTSRAWLGTPALAGDFSGDVHVRGQLHKDGGGFLIDHPLDPANKYLAHSFVESTEMKNVYDGVAVLDSQGEAIVELPDWFDVVNADFRYQLTPLTAAAPNLHIATELVAGTFGIAGGGEGMRVCWQVTGIRNDPVAKAHPLHVEQDKSPAEQGFYLHPELHGEPEARGITQARYQPQRSTDAGDSDREAIAVG